MTTTSSRKLDHIKICLERRVESFKKPFEDLMLVHRALPDFDLSDVDTSCEFLGRQLNAPIIICGMTGGHPETLEINANLARAAQEVGCAMGVGSQRAALEDPDLLDTFSVVREVAPDVPIVGNIGAIQLKREGAELVDRVSEMIDADAVAIHLNFLQECIQPEGETSGLGVIDVIRGASRRRVPIIVKETGAGICREDATTLLDAGVRIIDVGGVGGTSFAGVEAYRAEDSGDIETHQLGKSFWDWGIPTPVSVVECASSGAEVISSGGVRSGIDVAKSLALGASMAGVALPVLKPATESALDVKKLLNIYIRALGISMFLTGRRCISEMRCAPIVIGGGVREILEERGFDTKNFAKEREMAR